MASVVDIYNLALSNIKVSARVGSLADTANQKLVCDLWYPTVRDFVLGDAIWAFATRHEVALVADSVAPPSQWLYAYDLPSDCLRPQMIPMEGYRDLLPDQRIPFVVANNGTQRVIYTDQPDAKLTYTAQITDTTMFDPPFVMALAYLLGAEIGPSLSASDSVIQNCRNGYQGALSKALAKEGNSAFPGTAPMGEFLLGRL